MSKIMIDYNMLDNTISNIENEINNLKNLFDQQNKNFKLFEDNKMWYGESCQNCINKYMEVSNKYDDIITTLSNYKQFLINIKEAYKAIESADITANY